MAKQDRKASTIVKRRLLKLWDDSGAFLARLDELDKVTANGNQRAAIDSAQAAYRDWQYSNLGELLNEFGLPPEKR